MVAADVAQVDFQAALLSVLARFQIALKFNGAVTVNGFKMGSGIFKIAGKIQLALISFFFRKNYILRKVNMRGYINVISIVERRKGIGIVITKRPFNAYLARFSYSYKLRQG